MPLSVSRPFTTSLRHATDEELVVLNHYHRWSGPKELRPAPVELAALQNLNYSDSANLTRLAKHPDQRVQLALLNILMPHAQVSKDHLNRFKPPYPQSHPQGACLSEISARLKSEWDLPDSYAWNPVAEKLSLFPDPEANLFKAPLRVLEEWIQSDLVAAGTLLTSKSPLIHSLLAKYPRFLNPDQIHTLLSYNPKHLYTLVTQYDDVSLKNQLLTPLQLDTLGQVALERALSPGQGLAVEGTGALFHLANQNWYPDASAFSKLLDRLAPPYDAQTFLASGIQGRPDRPHFEPLFNYLLKLPLTKEQLRAFFDRANPTRSWVKTILRHLAVDLDFLKYVAAHNTDPSVQTDIFKNPEMAKDPVFRAQLSNTRAPNLWALLCLNATTEEFNHFYSLVLKYSPKLAIFVLEKADLPKNISFDATALTPFLTQEKQSKRERAIKAIGRLEGHMAAPKTIKKSPRLN